MPISPVTRTRIISRNTCLVGFTGNLVRLSYMFDATTLVADANGFFSLPIGTLMSISPADPTKVKPYAALGTNVNAVQTLTETGTPTGGTFTLTYAGQTTAPIAYNATAAAVATAVQALSNVGAAGGTVAGGGGAFPGAAITLTFGGTLGNQPVALLTATSTGLTGGASPAVTPTSTTPGQTAEAIIGVYDGPQRDFFGAVVAADEAITLYAAFASFDHTLIQNWVAYGAAAKAALPQSQFV